MKKLLAFLLAGAMMFSLAACGSDTEVSEVSVTEVESTSKVESAAESETDNTSAESSDDKSAVSEVVSVRAFNMEEGEDDEEEDDFLIFYYDSDKNVLKKMEAVIRMDSSYGVTKDMFDEVTVSDILDCDKDSALARVSTLELEEDDDYLYIKVIMFGLDDPDNADAIEEMDMFSDEMLNDDGTVAADAVIESFADEYPEVDPETFEELN